MYTAPRRIRHAAGGAFLALLAAAAMARARSEGTPRNLVPNGDFEKGTRSGPTGWQLPDGLTSFWAAAPGRKGRAMRISTDVLASQFREREDDIARALEAGRSPPPPPERKPTREPKYDTVAGLDGVHFSSDEIPISTERFYKLQVDVRVDGSAAPKVWVKAYGEVRSRDVTRTRVLWKKSLNCAGANRTWATYTMVFPRNTRLPEAVTRVRVQLYPFWPPATYYFDNVRLFEIDEAEARAYDLERDLRKPASGAGAKAGDR